MLCRKTPPGVLTEVHILLSVPILEEWRSLCSSFVSHSMQKAAYNEQWEMMHLLFSLRHFYLSGPTSYHALTPTVCANETTPPRFLRDAALL